MVPSHVNVKHPVEGFTYQSFREATCAKYMIAYRIWTQGFWVPSLGPFYLYKLGPDREKDSTPKKVKNDHGSDLGLKLGVAPC